MGIVKGEIIKMMYHFDELDIWQEAVGHEL